LRAAGALLGRDLRVTTCERYWKIPELWTCSAECALTSSAATEQIAECLLLASRLANGWYVLGPHLLPDGAIEHFEGVFNRREPAVAAGRLDWAEFQWHRRETGG
jgi:hypothetical protein